MNSSETRIPLLEVRLTLLSPADGGRHRGISSGYMPNVWLPDSPEPTLASASIELIGVDDLQPGMTATAHVFPFAPELWPAIEVGTELAMTEGPYRQVGRAIVTRVLVPAASAA